MDLTEPDFRKWKQEISTAAELHATCMAASESNYQKQVGVGGDDGHV